MVNEEKIRKMIDLARYERDEGKKNYIINSYFGFDYVERHMLGCFVAYTLCFLMVFGVIVIYRSDEIMGQTSIFMILEMFKPYFKYYVIGLLIYELIVLIVYVVRYSNGKKDIKMHNAELKRFDRRFYTGK
ncbi:MAG: hypothetical protein KBS51_05290 [Lachnospiraceae bacterium]|nr:hypothetical protein [Candidatus Darwinimomas equi]